MWTKSATYLSVLLCCIWLCGCVTTHETQPVTHHQVSKLSTELSKEALEALFADNTPKLTFQHQYNATEYKLSVYDLVVGSESVLDWDCQFFRRCLPVEVDVPITTDYLLIQSLPTLKLVEWGDVDALSESDDELARHLIAEIKIRLSNNENSSIK